MPIDTGDTELLSLYRQALAKIALGQSYNINGRALTMADLDKVKGMIEWLEDRINADDDETGGGSALVQFGERV